MTETLRQMIGVRVKVARQRAGMTQEALAQAIKRTPESISNIERGVQLPALDTLLDLARVLNIPAAELIGENEKPRKVSRQRAEAEARLMAVTADLSDELLEVGLIQLEALLGVKRRK